MLLPKTSAITQLYKNMELRQVLGGEHEETGGFLTYSDFTNMSVLRIFCKFITRFKPEAHRFIQEELSLGNENFFSLKVIVN